MLPSSKRDELSDERPALFAVALLFLRLGLTAFGGPAAHIAMMQEEIVTRRGWMRRAAFLGFSPLLLLLGAGLLIGGHRWLQDWKPLTPSTHKELLSDNLKPAIGNQQPETDNQLPTTSYQLPPLATIAPLLALASVLAL